MPKKKEPPDYPGDEAIKQKFGEAIRELRLEKGLSIEEVDAFIDERMNEEPCQQARLIESDHLYTPRCSRCPVH